MTDAIYRDLKAGDVAIFTYDPSNANTAEHSKQCPCLVSGAYTANDQTFVLLAPGSLVGPELPTPDDFVVADEEVLKGLSKAPGLVFDCPDRILVCTNHSRFVPQPSGSLAVFQLDSEQQAKIKNFKIMDSIFVDLSDDEWLYRLLADAQSSHEL